MKLFGQKKEQKYQFFAWSVFRIFSPSIDDRSPYSFYTILGYSTLLCSANLNAYFPCRCAHFMFRLSKPITCSIKKVLDQWSVLDQKRLAERFARIPNIQRARSKQIKIRSSIVKTYLEHGRYILLEQSKNTDCPLSKIIFSLSKVFFPISTQFSLFDSN